VSHCRVLPPGEFSDISSLSDVPHCRVLPIGEFNVMIPEPRATFEGERIPSAIVKIVFRRILFFPNAVWDLASGGFHIVFDTHIIININDIIIINFIFFHNLRIPSNTKISTR